MKKGVWVLYFSGRLSGICDYMAREATELSNNNVVVCFSLYARPLPIVRYFFTHRHLPMYYMHNNVYYLRSVYLLPLQRFRLIANVNRLLFVWIVLPIILRVICVKKKLEIPTERYFMFYRPEIEKKYFRYMFQALRVMGFKSVFNLVDYPPTGDSSTTNIYRDYIHKSDVVFANSHTLKNVFYKDRSDITIVPQGFALDEFRRTFVKKVQIQSDKPAIGFVGALGSRLDFRLLFALIERNQQWNFIFWGPTQFVDGDDKTFLKGRVRKLFSYTNVLHGVSRGKLNTASVISAFDIGIIPYDVSQKSNRYCYPMKLFEYFYMGKPVVSSPIEELKRFPKFVKIANAVQEWEEAITTLLAKSWPQAHKTAQKRLAIVNSWEKKIQKMMRVIEYEK